MAPSVERRPRPVLGVVGEAAQAPTNPPCSRKQIGPAVAAFHWEVHHSSPSPSGKSSSLQSLSSESALKSGIKFLTSAGGAPSKADVAINAKPPRSRRTDTTPKSSRAFRILTMKESRKVVRPDRIRKVFSLRRARVFSVRFSRTASLRATVSTDGYLGFTLIPKEYC